MPLIVFLQWSVGAALWSRIDETKPKLDWNQWKGPVKNKKNTHTHTTVRPNDITDRKYFRNNLAFRSRYRYRRNYFGTISRSRCRDSCSLQLRGGGSIADKNQNGNNL